MLRLDVCTILLKLANRVDGEMVMRTGFGIAYGYPEKFNDYCWQRTRDKAYE